MAEVKDFYKEAQQILKIIKNQIKQSDIKKIKQNLQQISKKFIKFYDYYYKDSSPKDLAQLINHQNKIKRLQQNTDSQLQLLSNFKNKQSIQHIVVKNVDTVRQLQTLALGFKALFLKTLGYDFIQAIVIEDQKKQFSPVIVEMDFKDFSNFIGSALDNFQGKLKSNEQMLKIINNKQRNALYTKKDIDSIYLQLYKQARRRLNIFYSKVKKSSFSGEGLLLYKPNRRWIKFWVSNFGDVKEGFLAIVVEAPALSSNIEERIQLFAENYIGKVDNTPGTLVQDIENIKQQISSKSGSARTGSNKTLIELIRSVSEGNFNRIAQIFEKDSEYANSGMGRRNRVLSNKQANQKVAKIIGEGSETLARKSINNTIRNIKNVELKGELI